MSIIENLREAFTTADQEGMPSDDTGLAADGKQPPPPGDLRCANRECDLFELRLEADEVAPTPGAQPDRCASCGQSLQPFS